jgi:hypothetical protein
MVRPIPAAPLARLHALAAVDPVVIGQGFT